MTKAYVVELSTKSEVRIDQDEVDKVMGAIAEGSVVAVRKGVINPSYIVGIHIDEDRMRDWARECGYTDGSGPAALGRGLKPLQSIFEGTHIGAMVEASREKKGFLSAPEMPVSI